MTTHLTTRLAAAGLLAVAAVTTTSTAHAVPLTRPDSFTVNHPLQADLRQTVLQLLDQGRQATTVAERRTVHHDLVQALRDGE